MLAYSTAPSELEQRVSLNTCLPCDHQGDPSETLKQHSWLLAQVHI